ncbi:MAG: hypothetical protein ACI3VM_08720 [Oscillospiraceae bacterium]
MASFRRYNAVSFDASHSIVTGEIDSILEVAHSVVIDIHDTKALRISRNYLAVLEINSNIVAAAVTIDIYGFPAGIKRAVIERITLAGICPQRIVHTGYAGGLSTGSIEDNIIKRSRFIAPVVSAPIENAVFQCDMVDIHQTLCIIRFNRSIRIATADNSHILKSNTITTLETVVTPAIRTVLLRSLNEPLCFLSAGANKGQAFACACAFYCRISSVAAVFTCAEVNGVVIFCGCKSQVKRVVILVSYFRMPILNRGRIRKCGERQEREDHADAHQKRKSAFSYIHCFSSLNKLIPFARGSLHFCY